MKPWIFDTLTYDPALGAFLNLTPEQMEVRVIPRQSQDSILIDKPYLVYALGNNTNEQLSEDPEHEAHRQFFTVYIHDEGGDFTRINNLIPLVKRALVGGQSAAHNLTNVYWLETSAEFDNQTYKTIFRYVRFQAIISKGVTL